MVTSHASLSTSRVQVGTLYFVALLREELGRRIKVARTAAKLTQQALAAAIGLKHGQDISRYERGTVEVPAHRIDLIAEATGRPRSYFTRDPSEPEALSDTSLEEVRRQLAAEAERFAELNDRLEQLLLSRESKPPTHRSRGGKVAAPSSRP